MQSFRRYLAEFIGTFIVVFIAAGAIVADLFFTHVRLDVSFGPLGIIAAYGLAVSVAMLAVMPISGAHVNPAISLAAYVSRRLSIQDLGGYVVAQLLGAVVAAYLLRAVAPRSAWDFASGGVPGLASGVSVLAGAAIEVVLTFFLAFTFWAVFMDKRGPRFVAPLAIGLVVVMGGLVGFAFTGAAMNPARWFGPALAHTTFKNWLVWVPAPLLGALLGSLAYETLFMSDTPAVAAIGDEEELAEEGGDEEEVVALVVAEVPPPPEERPAP